MLRDKIETMVGLKNVAVGLAIIVEKVHSIKAGELLDKVLEKMDSYL